MKPIKIHSTQARNSMTDVEKNVDGLKYDQAGYLRFPKFEDEPIGVIYALFSFAFPFGVLWDKWKSPFSIELLNNVLLFRGALAKGLLSQPQVDNAGLLLVCLALLTALGVPIYIRKNLKKLSGFQSLSAALKRRWLIQIVLMIGMGAAFVVMAIGLEKLLYWGFPLDRFTPGGKSMFLILFGLSAGAFFVVEGGASALLYVCSYFNLWKK